MLRLAGHHHPRPMLVDNRQACPPSPSYRTGTLRVDCAFDAYSADSLHTVLTLTFTAMQLWEVVENRTAEKAIQESLNRISLMLTSTRHFWSARPLELMPSCRELDHRISILPSLQPTCTGLA